MNHNTLSILNDETLIETVQTPLNQGLILEPGKPLKINKSVITLYSDRECGVLKLKLLVDTPTRIELCKLEPQVILDVSAWSGIVLTPMSYIKTYDGQIESVFVQLSTVIREGRLIN